MGQCYKQLMGVNYDPKKLLCNDHRLNFPCILYLTEPTNLAAAVIYDRKVFIKPGPGKERLFTSVQALRVYFQSGIITLIPLKPAIAVFLANVSIGPTMQGVNKMAPFAEIIYHLGPVRLLGTLPLGTWEIENFALALILSMQHVKIPSSPPPPKWGAQYLTGDNLNVALG
jgi:hypothetical protein